MLYDKILSDIIDDSGNITDTARNSIIGDIKEVLVNGTNILPPTLKGLLSESENFDGIPEYNDLDLQDKEKFPQLHNETIDILFASSLSTINLQGQTPIPLVFDPTGLLPDLPPLPEADIPPKFFKLLLNILSIPENEIRVLINEFLSSQIPPLPNFTGNILSLVDLNEEQILQTIGIIIPTTGTQEEIQNFIKQNFDNFRSIFIETIKNKILASAGEEIKQQLLDTFKILFPPPTFIPPLFLKPPPLPPVGVDPNKINNLINDVISKNLQFINSISGLQNQITSFVNQLINDKLNQYLNIVKIPLETITSLVFALFEQVLSGAFNPIQLVKDVLGELKNQIIGIVSQSIPSGPIKLVMSIAIAIIFIKYLASSIIKVIVGNILGKGQAGEGLATLLFQ